MPVLVRTTVQGVVEDVASQLADADEAAGVVTMARAQQATAHKGASGQGFTTPPTSRRSSPSPRAPKSAASSAAAAASSSSTRKLRPSRSAGSRLAGPRTSEAPSSSHRGRSSRSADPSRRQQHQLGGPASSSAGTALASPRDWSTSGIRDKVPWVPAISTPTLFSQRGDRGRSSSSRGSTPPQSARSTPRRRRDQCYQELYADAAERQKRRQEQADAHEEERLMELEARASSLRAMRRYQSLDHRSVLERSEDHLRRKAELQEEAKFMRRRREEEELQGCIFRPRLRGEEPTPAQQSPATALSASQQLRDEHDVMRHLRQLARKQAEIKGRLQQLDRDWRKLQGQRSRLVSQRRRQRTEHFAALAGSASPQQVERIEAEVAAEVDAELEVDSRGVDFKARRRVLLETLEGIEARAAPTLQKAEGRAEDLLQNSGFTPGLAQQLRLFTLEGADKGGADAASPAADVAASATTTTGALAELQQPRQSAQQQEEQEPQPQQPQLQGQPRQPQQPPQRLPQRRLRHAPGPPSPSAPAGPATTLTATPLLAPLKVSDTGASGGGGSSSQASASPAAAAASPRPLLPGSAVPLSQPLQQPASSSPQWAPHPPPVAAAAAPQQQLSAVRPIGASSPLPSPMMTAASVPATRPGSVQAKTPTPVPPASGAATQLQQQHPQGSALVPRLPLPLQQPLLPPQQQQQSGQHPPPVLTHQLMSS